MRIAIYYDLPAGGAAKTMEEMESRWGKKHQLDIYHNQGATFSPPFLKRVFADFESIVLQRIKQRKQADQIDQKKYDLVFVTHDSHFQAPWILRYLKTPTLFLCQEPTRAFFEEFLGIDPKLPLVNRLYETFIRNQKKKIEIVNAQKASVTVANSIYSSESIFRAYGVTCRVVYMGVDFTEFYPEKVAKKNYVMAIGNNEPQKNLKAAVEAVSLVKESIRPKLVIVSPRKGRRFGIEEYAKNFPVKLEIKESIPLAELRKCYSSAKLTLAVARLETFGLSVIESYACATPVIAVREGGYKEIVIHNQTGLLASPTPKDIALSIEEALSNPQKMKLMAENGLKMAQNFTWDKTSAELEKIFYEISKTKNSRHYC